MPGFPAMPPMPSISAGGGGPSDARSSNGGGGGFDGSGWAINFNGTQSTDSGAAKLTPPAGFGFSPDQFGLPHFGGGGSIAAGPSTGGGITLTPTVIALAVAVFMIARRRRG